MLKISGEGLSKGTSKYSEETLSTLAEQLKTLLEKGNQIMMVIGGGNLFRGKDLSEELNIKRSTADYIGMLATTQNALVVRDFLISKNIETRVLNSISMPQLAEAYIPQKVGRHLEKGRVVIFAGGTGLPYFTTDTTTIQRALENSAELVVALKNGVDGVYSNDPKIDKNAKKYTKISASDALNEDLKVVDSAALALAREHGMDIKVIAFEDLSELDNENVGTLVIGK